ncbi:MAG: hypothetical protein D6730_10150 [Bacteroidetes bacterium]|nr:MAG: hypothetical protein D6730_10150 [Bacteroidota bacterium]
MSTNMKTTVLKWTMSLLFVGMSSLMGQQQLKAQWMQAEEELPFPPPTMPKPLLAPATEETEPGPLPPALAPKVVPAPYRLDNSPPATSPAIPLIYPHERAQLDRQTACSFFGQHFSLYYHTRMSMSLPYRASEAEISQLWAKLQRSPYQLVLKQLRRQARNLRLNDWGFALLVHETARRIYPRDVRAQRLYEGLMLSQSGFDLRLAMQSGKLYLLMPAEQVIYGATYFRREGKKYYVLELGARSPRVEEARVLDLPGISNGRKKLNFELAEAPLLPGKQLIRKLRFYYRGQTHHFEVPLNQHLLDFYRQYPFVDLEVKFGAPLSEQARQALLPQLGRLVADMSETEAVNLLLRFVQTAFEYQTDGEQFGEETYMFAEQTLYYPYSDCEDRSVLFAFLVRELLGLPTIGLVFPGHVATGVRFSRPAEGAYVQYRGEKYYLCDPTYMYATYGTVMPEVAGQSVKVVMYE